jgi:hypothetical protein
MEASLVLLDGDFGAADGAAGEGADFAALHFYGAVFGSMNGKVAAHSSASTGTLGGANLANNNFAVFDHLAAKAFDAKALTDAIARILGSTTGFNM